MKAMLYGAALAACLCSAPSVAATFDLKAIEAAAANDLEAAKADAAAHGDTLAYTCYAGVESYGAAHPFSAPTARVVGVASAFQTGRDAVKLAETVSSSGIPVELETACGPLALDVQSDLGRAARSFVFLGVHF